MRNAYLCLSAFLLLVLSFPLHAQVPANDDWANRAVISSLPYTVTGLDISGATIETTDPDPPCRLDFTIAAYHSLWYSYTTSSTTEYLTFKVPDNNLVEPIVVVYTGSPGAFEIVSGGCASYSQNDGVLSLAGLRLAPNTTYSIEVATGFEGLSSSNTLELSVTASSIYQVTKTADTNDGTCNSSCSLRDAIAASNANPGAVLIPAGTYTLTIPGAEEYNDATGSLDAVRGMGIYGAGMQSTIIDANSLDRALMLDPSASQESSESYAIGDLSIIHGNAGSNPYHQVGGGGIWMDSNSDYLGLERVSLTNNYALYGGGGLALNSPGTIRDSIISNNTSNGADGGGGIYTLTDDSRYVEISDSTISGNAETNQAGGAGGGIYTFTSLYVTNSTISENQANGRGGGIDVESYGSVHLANSTVVFNSGQVNPNLSNSGGGIHMASYTPSTFSNSIIAKNTVANPNDPPDCAMDMGSMTSSYDIIGSSGGTCTFTGAGDVTGVDPLVSTLLANNGGLTPTHALLSGSPAINAGDPNGCVDAFGAPLTVDQRGVSRSEGGRCDIGAYEFQDEIFKNGFE